MTLDVGDWRQATLTVEPADETTTAALTVVSPDGTETTVSVAPGDTTATWRSEAYELCMPGEWIERWTVTGTGAGAQRAVVLVAPDPVDTPDGQRVYASTADYARWLGAAPPPGARRALAAASRVVDELLICAVYAVDERGMPTNPAVAAALRDATCAQATYQAELGDPDSIGAGAYSEVQLGSARLVRTTQAPPGMPARTAPHAEQILRSAGLLGGQPLTPWAVC